MTEQVISHDVIQYGRRQSFSPTRPRDLSEVLAQSCGQFPEADEQDQHPPASAPPQLSERTSRPCNGSNRLLTEAALQMLSDLNTEMRRCATMLSRTHSTWLFCVGTLEEPVGQLPGKTLQCELRVDHELSSSYVRRRIKDINAGSSHRSTYEGEMRQDWSGTGMHGQGKREIPEKARRPAASRIWPIDAQGNGESEPELGSRHIVTSPSAILDITDTDHIL
ncbi:hypothetical protein PR048_002677 [Dryococelus australis]|uniref:Uncharacterized protein n=1 Tax=Dryococelus australis TaxID=614101 RepID=A0ABQ9IKV2_9NEOP|nr:hypothetical protein PR048_002677 [Dryococelus australis]